VVCTAEWNFQQERRARERTWTAKRLIRSTQIKIIARRIATVKNHGTAKLHIVVAVALDRLDGHGTAKISKVGHRVSGGVRVERQQGTGGGSAGTGSKVEFRDRSASRKFDNEVADQWLSNRHALKAVVTTLFGDPSVRGSVRKDGRKSGATFGVIVEQSNRVQVARRIKGKDEVATVTVVVWKDAGTKVGVCEFWLCVCV